MPFLQMIVLALLAGAIGAGLVWYGWGLAENVQTVIQSRRIAQEIASRESDDSEDQTEGGGEETEVATS